MHGVAIQNGKPNEMEKAVLRVAKAGPVDGLSANEVGSLYLTKPRAAIGAPNDWPHSGRSVERQGSVTSQTGTEFPTTLLANTGGSRVVERPFR